MVKVIEFLRKERLYILLLIFIILLNVLMLSAKEEKGKAKKTAISQRGAVTKIEGKAKALDERLFVMPEEAQNLLRKKRPLAAILSLSSLLVLAILILGLIINMILLSVKLAGKDIDIHTYRSGRVDWNMWDVSKVVILFLFFG